MCLWNFISRLHCKIIKMSHGLKIYYLGRPQLEELLKVTPFDDIRKAIWIKLGNAIGENVKINRNITVVGSNKLKPNVILHDRVALGPNICFITSSSPNNSILKDSYYAKRYIKELSIEIGEDTWIGANSVIQPGVCIGKRCIIGACSNVTKNIPDDTLAYGNPVKLVRRLGVDS